MGFMQSATYADAMQETAEFNWEFVGYPDGKVVVASDYLCISNATKYPEIAFEVAKFLSYGSEGVKARFDILDADTEGKIQLTGFPISTNPEIAEKWFDYIVMPGAEKIYNKVLAGEIEQLIEGNKTVPGFQKARFDYDTGIIIEGVRENSTLKIGDLLLSPQACRKSLYMGLGALS